MKKMKVLSFCLAGLFFVESAMAGSMEDIEAAYQQTSGATCEQQEKSLKELDSAYKNLGSLEAALAKSQIDRPYVEVLKDVRNTAAILTTVSAVFVAVGVFRARIAREGQYAMPVAIGSQYIAAVATSIAGVVTATAQAGYVLTNDDIVEFKSQIKVSRKIIQRLRDELRNCR